MFFLLFSSFSILNALAAEVMAFSCFLFITGCRTFCLLKCSTRAIIEYIDTYVHKNMTFTVMLVWIFIVRHSTDKKRINIHKSVHVCECCIFTHIYFISVLWPLKLMSDKEKYNISGLGVRGKRGENIKNTLPKSSSGLPAGRIPLAAPYRVGLLP